MLLSIARNRVKVTRQQTIGGTQTATTDPATIETIYQPNIATTILLALDVATPAATATVTGTDKSDAVITEEYAFTTGIYQQGVKTFKTVTSVSLVGLEGKTVEMKYRGVDGSAVKAQRVIYNCINCQISYSTQKWPNERSGTVETGKVKIQIPVLCNSADQRLREGDLVEDLDSGYTYLVVGVGIEAGVGINSFQTVFTERREGT